MFCNKKPNGIPPEGDNAILPRQRSQVRPARRIPNNRSNRYLLNIGVRRAEPRQVNLFFRAKIECSRRGGKCASPLLPDEESTQNGPEIRVLCRLNGPPVGGVA